MNFIQLVFTLLPLNFTFEPSTGVFADSVLHINRTYELPDTRGQAQATVSVAAGTYDVTVTAWGSQGPQGWPTVSFALSADGSPQASLAFASAQPQEYRTRMVFFSDNPTIWLRLTNDSYDPITKNDTNAFIRSITLSNIGNDTVTVAWDANPEKDLAGYRLYRGYASRDYDEAINTGLVTSYDLLLERGVSHFLSVTAYDSGGNESAYSDEVVYFAPSSLPPTVSIVSPTPGQSITSKTLHVSAMISGDYSRVSHAAMFFGVNGRWEFPVSSSGFEQVVQIDEANGAHQLRIQLVGMQDDFQVVLHETIVAVNVQIPDTTPPGPVRNLRVIKK